jgi:hypothetical protein
MITVNRTAIVVKPKQAFLDWLHQADPTSHDLTPEDLREDCTVYLIPECDTPEELREQMEDACRRIFEDQLDGWYRVPATWPKRRGLDAFELCFEWSSHSVVIDLSRGPLFQEGM